MLYNLYIQEGTQKEDKVQSLYHKQASSMPTTSAESPSSPCILRDVQQRLQNQKCVFHACLPGAHKKEVLLGLGGSSCMVKICPKVPLRGTPKKWFLWGTRKHKNQKSSKNQLIGPFSFIFKKTDCPGKIFISLKMHYFFRKTMTFCFFYHLCFPMRIPMSFQSFPKPVFENHVAHSTTRSIFWHHSLREASRKYQHNTAKQYITGKNVPPKVTAKRSSKRNP